MANRFLMVIAYSKYHSPPHRSLLQYYLRSTRAATSYSLRGGVITAENAESAQISKYLGVLCALCGWIGLLTYRGLRLGVEDALDAEGTPPGFAAVVDWVYWGARLGRDPTSRLKRPALSDLSQALVK